MFETSPKVTFEGNLKERFTVFLIVY